MGCGIILMFAIRYSIKSKGWSSRKHTKSINNILYLAFKLSFYLSIIGLCCSISLIIGSKRIIKKEIDNVVNQSVEYIKKNYFKDSTSTEQIFAAVENILVLGSKLNESNHLMAEAITNEISTENGFGFLGPILLHKSKNNYIKQLEEIEKSIFTILVSYGLEKIRVDNAIPVNQLDKAFYAWLHNDYNSNTTSPNQYISEQLNQQIQPIIIGLWMPLLLPCLIIFLLFTAGIILNVKQSNSKAISD